MALPCARAWARRRRALAAALALALAATLPGCQSNPEPPPLDRAATSSSPAPSPALTAPTLPPEARGTSKAAAKAFVRHYFDAVNHAMESGDTAYLRSLAERRCKSCQTVSGNIEETYESGGSITSRGWLVQSVSVVPLQPNRRPILDLGVLMTPERVVERKGAKAKTYNGGKQPMTLYLVLVQGEWKVARLDLVR